MTINMLLLSAGLLIAFYAIIKNRVTVLLHPMRIDLAEVGAFLTDCKDLPAHHQKMVQSAMDGAYSVVRAWLYVLLMPVAMVMAVVETVMGKKDETLTDVPADIRAELRQVCFQSFVSTMANSPIAAVIMCAQLSVFLVLFLPISTIVHDAMHTVFEVEKRSAHFSANFSHMRHAA